MDKSSYVVLLLPVSSIDLVHGDKVSDEDQSFLTREWSVLEGDEAAMAGSAGIAIAWREDGETIAVVKGWCAGGVGYLSELMVRSDRRGSGIGTKMLAAFEQESLANDARRLALRVEASSPARQFYERSGWKTEIVIDDWLGGHEYVQMRKDLPPEPP